MANLPVTIQQGDYIYYYDTSTGNIDTRNWYFPGGSPTGGTSAGPTVRYLISNTLGYNVGLSVGDVYVTAQITENNLIYVFPEISNLSLETYHNGTPISSSDMSYDVTFLATGGTGTGIMYYAWNLPGIAGFTGTSNTVTTNIYDWKDLTTSEFGAAYSTFLGSAQVTAHTNLNNVFNASNSVNYNKSGVSESINLADYPTATGPTSHNVSYFLVSTLNVSIRTSSIGMSGNGLLLEISQPSGSIFDNSSFHVQTEPLLYYSPSLDLSNYLISGQVIASLSAFTTMGVSINPAISSLTRYTQGRYMYPYDIGTYFNGTFYFADVNNQLAYLLEKQEVVPKFQKYVWTKRHWSENSINLLMNDTSFGSVSSKNIELLQTRPSGVALGLTGGFGVDDIGGPCLPSQNLTISDVELYFDVYCDSGRNLSSSTLVGSFTVVGSTGKGNSPNGNVLLAQDTLDYTKTGLVSILNTAFASNDLSPYIGATASQNLSYFETYDKMKPADYNGIRISILDDYVTSSKGTLPFGITTDTYLLKVVMSTNYTEWDSPYDQFQGMIYLGINQTTITNPHQSTNPTTPKREWGFSG